MARRNCDLSGEIAVLLQNSPHFSGRIPTIKLRLRLPLPKLPVNWKGIFQ
jgi:hypothetical protein